MCTHTYTERHVTYQFILQFSSKTKTEAEGNREVYHVLLTMTCFGSTYRAHTAASESHFARCCTKTHKIYFKSIIHFQFFLKIPEPKDMSNSCQGHMKKIRWHHQAQIKQKMSAVYKQVTATQGG